MMLLLALTVLVTGAAGQANQQAPQPCCINHQFTTVLGQIGESLQPMAANGVLLPSDGYQILTFDYDAKLIGATHHIFNATRGTYDNNHILEDYNTMKRYITSADGSCVYMHITVPMQSPCVPANSTFVGAVTMGSGHSTIKSNVWAFTLPGTQATGELVVSADNCTPLIEAYHGDVAGVETITTYAFFNFEPSITNRTALTLPAADQCKPKPTPNPHNPAVGRRSVLFG